MITAKITPRKDKKNSHGLCPMVIQFSFAKEVNRIPLGISLKAEDFDFENSIVRKSCSEHKKYNQVISDANKKLQLILPLAEDIVSNTFDLPLFNLIKDLYQSQHDEINETLIKGQKDVFNFMV